MKTFTDLKMDKVRDFTNLVEWNGVGSNLYLGNEIISKKGFRAFQDLLAGGRIEKTSFLAPGNNVYRLKQ